MLFTANFVQTCIVAKQNAAIMLELIATIGILAIKNSLYIKDMPNRDRINPNNIVIFILSLNKRYP